MSPTALFNARGSSGSVSWEVRSWTGHILLPLGHIPDTSRLGGGGV